MITSLLFSILDWFVERTLSLVTFVVPSYMMDLATTGFGFLGQFLSFGPAGIVGIVILAYLAWDTTLNAIVFAVTTYKLIPLKGT